MNPSVIVTGATSFISITLIEQLLEKNYSVFAIARPNSTGLNLISSSKGLTIIESELSDLEKLDLDNITECSTLFHIGWTSDFVNSRYNLDGQLKNVEYTLGAVELAKRYSCKSFVGIGSQAECGRVKSPISAHTPDKPENAYGIAKCKAAELSLRLCEQYGIRHHWPRLLSAYGPYDKSHTFIMSCLNACLNNQFIELTACEQIWDFIYVEDVARALILIAGSGRHGVKYPIASGIHKSLYKYVEEIVDLTGTDILVRGIGKKEYDANQVMNLCGDISETTRDTGFYPEISFREGIKRTLKLLNDRVVASAVLPPKR